MIAWIIGGIVSFVLLGGGGWLAYRSRSVDVERADRANEKAAKAEKVLDDVQKAKAIDDNVAAMPDDDVVDELSKWRRKK